MYKIYKLYIMQVADRGFTYGEYTSMALAEVKTPPFTRGKKQLERMEVDWSWELSIVTVSCGMRNRCAEAEV